MANESTRKAKSKKKTDDSGIELKAEAFVEYLQMLIAEPGKPDKVRRLAFELQEALREIED